MQYDIILNMNDLGVMSTEELLARIDERTKLLTDKMNHIESMLDNKYVTKEEFYPVKTLVYGVVGLMLTTVVGALVLMVIK